MSVFFKDKASKFREILRESDIVASASTPTKAGLGAGNCIWVLGFSGLQIALQFALARSPTTDEIIDPPALTRSSLRISPPSSGAVWYWGSRMY